MRKQSERILYGEEGEPPPQMKAVLSGDALQAVALMVVHLRHEMDEAATGAAEAAAAAAGAGRGGAAAGAPAVSRPGARPAIGGGATSNHGGGGFLGKLLSPGSTPREPAPAVAFARAPAPAPSASRAPGAAPGPYGHLLSELEHLETFLGDSITFATLKGERHRRPYDANASAQTSSRNFSSADPGGSRADKELEC